MDNTVLIIDDDEEMCAELKEILTDEGFQVQVASNGTIGRGLIEGGCFGVIILDVKLPGMNGVDILKIIKQNNKDQKVLIFSGKAMGQDPLSLNDCERESTEVILSMADAVLNKPVVIEVLLQKIKELAVFPEKISG